MGENVIHLPNKSVFLDFCLIEHTLYKKHEVLPKNFFTENKILKSIKTEFELPKLCFVDHKVYLSDDVSIETIEKLKDQRTNIIASVNNRVYSKIIRNISDVEDHFSGLGCSNFKSISPYWFSVDQINNDGSINFNFPDRYSDTMLKNETYCFFCQRMPRSDGEWFTSGVLLVLFVKNYGLFDQIEIISKDRIERMTNTESYLSKKTKLRDFSKSSLLFELS